jgi:hypothetical protein
MLLWSLLYVQNLCSVINKCLMPLALCDIVLWVFYQYDIGNGSYHSFPFVVSEWELFIDFIWGFVIKFYLIERALFFFIKRQEEHIHLLAWCFKTCIGNSQKALQAILWLSIQYCNLKEFGMQEFLQYVSKYVLWNHFNP